MVRIVVVVAVCLLASLVPGCDCHKVPLWSGEVEVAPIERPDVRACGAGGPTPRGRAQLSRAPYLQDVGATAAVVAFAGATRGTTVELATPEGEALAELAATRRPGPSEPTVARFTGLAPDTLYCYRVVAPAGPLTAWAPLRTAPPPGTDEPVHFVVLGDTGTGSPAQRAIARRLEETPFDLLWFLGDLAYPKGTAAQLQAYFFDIYREQLAIAPSYAVIGNHDRDTRDGAPYFDAFVLPENERYYSFNWGPVHFAAIDTTRLDRAQIRWLERDLAAAEQPWTIVLGHHPVLSSSLRGTDVGLAMRLVPALDRHGVDLYLAGHEHHYERFAPVGGVHYVVSGGGGAQLRRFYGDRGAVTQAEVHHYLAFEVTRERLEMRAIGIDGRVLDRLVLEPFSPAALPPLPVSAQSSPATRSSSATPSPTCTGPYSSRPGTSSASIRSSSSSRVSSSRSSSSCIR